MSEAIYIAGPECFYIDGNARLNAMRRIAEARGHSATLPNDTPLKLDNEDLRKNADTIFAGTCVDLDEAGNHYVSEGNHRVLTAKALRFVKEFITGKKIDKPLEFTGTISRIRVKNRSEESTGWEY